ncbi:hypothetical protein Tco_0988133 [Tanacetum coccineum]|uniref:Uncharacterized protein n=1 Tax=Tanacetum coccineum TaxID=301880 RepID=A0ABQ5EQH5_9ASTR
MEYRVESFMRNEVLFYYEGGFTLPKRPYQEELEARILNLMDHQEDQIRQLKEDMRKTKDTFMCLADSLIETLKVSMISNIKSAIYKTPHQHLNSNLKMPILHSFEENKLEYEDEDEVEIKMMGTGMDKESLKHNLYENDITPTICHMFCPTSNPPTKPKDLGSFKIK